MAQRQRLRPYGQPTLVHMRRQHLELHSQDGLDARRSPHARATSPVAGSRDLLSGKLLVDDLPTCEVDGVQDSRRESAVAGDLHPGESLVEGHPVYRFARRT